MLNDQWIDTYLLAPDEISGPKFHGNFKAEILPLNTHIEWNNKPGYVYDKEYLCLIRENGIFMHTTI